MWTPSDSENLYHVPRWGGGYFAIDGQGHLQVTPDGKEGPSIDLHDLIGTIRRRGVAAPMLLRFDGILRSRVRELNAAFNRARREFGYRAPYRGVYPIKVNQERCVVDALLEEGRGHGMGLEVGSKPELIAGIAVAAAADSLLICNGYKDAGYVEMALLSSQLGSTTILVVEKLTELNTVLEGAARLGIKPHIGVRAKLSFQGSGRWQDSIGDRSKFGLTTREIVEVVERLRAEDMLDCLELLHFHMGSQISHVRSLKGAMREATNVLKGLTDMGVEIQWFDAGGGLGVDYDGSKSATDSSMNYSVQEYANDIVWHLVEACENHGLRQPTIITESGRALAAHHSVLVGEVLGSSGRRSLGITTDTTEDEHELVRELAELCEGDGAPDLLERYHDAQEARDRAMMLFTTGQLSLPDRARIEELFFRVSELVHARTQALEHVPDDFQHLERDLADTYFVNASIFQSMPDSWAIDQLFPVVPLQRLDEEPTRRAIIADLTCDSDGKITKFIGLDGPEDTLAVHALRPDEPYYLGFFLVGAYQEILGDMHNLFGDTHVVHVDVDTSGRPRVTHVQRGDRVKDVLGYLEYFE
ncbi:MAG: biosynthetic arginine decarboxylase, partial [Planctomycetota bacterium]|nr:biosynthetic arginine decarboxylase [Planctomycetota bacterium]